MYQLPSLWTCISQVGILILRSTGHQAAAFLTHSPWPFAFSNGSLLRLPMGLLFGEEEAHLELPWSCKDKPSGPKHNLG